MRSSPIIKEKCWGLEDGSLINIEKKSTQKKHGKSDITSH
jgi:hypothetical protein